MFEVIRFAGTMGVLSLGLFAYIDVSSRKQLGMKRFRVECIMPGTLRSQD